MESNTRLIRIEISLTRPAVVALLALFAVIAIGLLLALGPAMSMESRDHAINWDVMDGGGGYASSASHSIQGSIGQPLIGFKANASHRFCSGYWCGAGEVHTVYLPCIVR